MTISDTRRLGMFESLRNNLGEEPASTLMEHLPPGGWGQVATKSDVTAAEGRLNARIDALRGEMSGKFGEVDGRFEAIDGKFEAIDGRFEAIGGKFDGLRGDVKKWIANATYTVLIALAGAALAVYLAQSAGG